MTRAILIPYPSPPDLFLALAINVFFRKSFRVEPNYLQISALIAFSFANDTICVAFLIVYAFFAAFLNQDFHHVGIRNWDGQDAINLMVTWRWVVYASHILNVSTVDLLWHWSYYTIVAHLQVQRNPRVVKNALRRLRVAFGPATILSSALLAFLTVRSDADWLIRALAAFAGLSSLIAGVVLRPDNDVVLSAITEERHLLGLTVTQLHGVLNVLSVGLAIVIRVIS